MDNTWTTSAFGLQPHAHLMHEDAAERSRGYICLHAGCKVICASAALLDEHIATHFETCVVARDAPSEYHHKSAITINQEHTISGYVPDINTGATGLSQIDTAATHNRFLSPYVTLNAIPEIPLAYSSFTNNSDPANPTSPSFSTEVKPKIPCSQCTKTFVRAGDVERHAKIHAKGMPEYECPAPECARKGMKGFWRKDKMMDHYRCRHGRKG